MVLNMKYYNGGLYLKAKFTVTVVVILLLILVTYGWFHNDKNQSTEDRIKNAIEHESGDVNNLTIYKIEEFRGNYLVLYCFDLADSHCLACRYINENNGLGGGSGPSIVDRSQPMSISHFANEPFNHVISYGEIYDTEIAAIDLEYRDGEIIRATPENGAFLVTADKNINQHPGIIRAYNNKGEVIFQLPK